MEDELDKAVDSIIKVRWDLRAGQVIPETEAITLGNAGATLETTVLYRGYSAHSMRATFITTTLENGASLEEVQKAAGHRDPGTTNLYDRRSYNPEKSASHRANY